MRADQITSTFYELYETSDNYVFFKNCQSEYLYAKKKMHDASNQNNIEGKNDFDLPWEDIAEKYRNDDNFTLQGKMFYDIESFVINDEKLNVKVIKIPILIMDT